MNSTLEVLCAARELISSPEHFARRAQATNDLGVPLDPTSRKATRWDMIGAVIRSYVLDLEAAPALEELAKVIKSHNPSQQTWRASTVLAIFSDEAAHERVLEIFDKAIADLQSQAQEPPQCQTSNDFLKPSESYVKSKPKGRNLTWEFGERILLTVSQPVTLVLVPSAGHFSIHGTNSKDFFHAGVHSVLYKSSQRLDQH